MDRKQYLLTYDVGTTGMKTCLFSAVGHLELISSSLAKYPLYLLSWWWSRARS
nr:hypothetical protein [uncultured Sphaerochaeta sp.]